MRNWTAMRPSREPRDPSEPSSTFPYSKAKAAKAKVRVAESIKKSGGSESCGTSVTLAPEPAAPHAVMTRDNNGVPPHPTESGSVSLKSSTKRGSVLRPLDEDRSVNALCTQIEEFPSLTTDGVHVGVRVLYRPDISDPSAMLFLWLYEVKITNLRDDTITVNERRWWITDGDGKKEDVYGKGLVGRGRQISSGAQFVYVSGVPLRTPNGTMEGVFEITTANGGTVWTKVPEFRLHAPYSSRSPEIDIPDYKSHVAQFSKCQIKYIWRSLRSYQKDATRYGEARFSISNLKSLPTTLQLTFMRILMSCRIYGETGKQFFLDSHKSHLNVLSVYSSDKFHSIECDDVFIHAPTLYGDVDISIVLMREEDDYEAAKRVFLERWAKKQNQPVGVCRDVLDKALNSAEAEVTRRARPPRPKWPSDALPHEVDNPAAFAWRAYAFEASEGILHMKMIRQEDRRNGTTLAVDLVSWLRSKKNQTRIPEGFDIPTIDDWNTRELERRGNALKTSGKDVTGEAIRLYSVALKRAQREREKAILPALKNVN